MLLLLNGAGRMVCRKLGLTQVLPPNGLPIITLPLSNNQDIQSLVIFWIKPAGKISMVSAATGAKLMSVICAAARGHAGVHDPNS